MTSYLYSARMDKETSPNTLESLQPCSGLYSIRKDFMLNGWLAVAVALYVTGELLVKWHPEWNARIRAAAELAPLVPGLLYIRSWARFIKGLDELQRRIQLEAWLFAAVGTVVIGIVISTLGASGIHLGDLEHGLGMGRAFIASFGLWLAGSALASRRFK
jgi:hypothetical protein